MLLIRNRWDSELFQDPELFVLYQGILQIKDTVFKILIIFCFNCTEITVELEYSFETVLRIRIQRIRIILLDPDP